MEKEKIIKNILTTRHPGLLIFLLALVFTTIKHSSWFVKFSPSTQNCLFVSFFVDFFIILLYFFKHLDM